jgi:hypothetical protein
MISKAPSGIRYYAHSGEYSLIGMVAATVGGLVAGIALAWIYETSLYWIPLIYANLLACGAFGGAVGLCTTWILRCFKCRNTILAMGLGLLVTAVAYLASWDFWIYRLLDNQAPGQVSQYAVATNPSAVWRMAVKVNHIGTWSMSTSSPAVKGVFLWIIWIAEAVTIFVCSLMAAKLVSDTPFCESCGNWCKKKAIGTEIRLLSREQAAEDATRIASGDFAVIAARGMCPVGDAEWIGFEVYRCENCGQTVTLTVKSAQVVQRNGQRQTQSKNLVSKALLSPEQYEQFRAAFTPLVQADAEAPAEGEQPQA